VSKTDSTQPEETWSGRRDYPAAAKRVLIIGLDGATFDVLNPMMEAGRMPRLAEAVKSGAAGVLHSTVPPITPAAWTTFLTGKQPGSHGIIDFERYDALSNKLDFNSTRCLDHVRNLWQLLSARGLRVGSINVPMTYPPIKVNGFMISGFETPGPQSEFAYPPELKPRILERWPDPTLRTKWRRKTFGGDALFAANIDYMTRSFHQGTEMTKWCGQEYGWDVLMVVLKLVDNLQHKAWKYLDPRWSERNPRRRDLARQAFSELDVAVGELLNYAAANEAAVLMVSDHGHGSLEGKVQPNLLLQRWGYLALRGWGAQTGTRLRYYWDRLRGRTGKFARAGDVLHDLPVDFSRTRACVMHAGMAGFVYLNLKGRQPEGTVEPDDYEALRDELRARFLGPDCRVRAPDGRRIGLFTAAHKPEELYGCTRAEQPWLPDLMLIPARELAAVRKIRGSKPVRWLPYRKLEGTHRPEGILIACGSGVARGKQVEAQIADCAPTILALLGLRVPSDMEGKVVADLFAEAPAVEFEQPGAERAAAQVEPADADEAYSDAELEAVKARLSDLGYLE